jgi:biopolymer transport protein ExbD
LKALKLGALQQDTNVKTLINQAIEVFLASSKSTPDTQETKGKKEPEKPFHVLVNAKNLKALKVKAIQEETTVKDLINRAIKGIL